MSYVIYNPQTWRILKLNGSQAIYKEQRTAKAQYTRAKNNGVINDSWKVDTLENYQNNEPMVETYNMLDPERKPFNIRMSDKGTCCDPATESYHSM